MPTQKPITVMDSILSESSFDQTTTPLKKEESPASSLGSLLDDYNDDDLEKTNAALGMGQS